MSFDTWYELNEYVLKEKFVKENPDLSILDDDYADLYLRWDFQEYCDKEYNKRWAKWEN